MLQIALHGQRPDRMSTSEGKIWESLFIAVSKGKVSSNVHKACLDLPSLPALGEELLVPTMLSPTHHRPYSHTTSSNINSTHSPLHFVKALWPSVMKTPNSTLLLPFHGRSSLQMSKVPLVPRARAASGMTAAGKQKIWDRTATAPAIRGGTLGSTLCR